MKLNNLSGSTLTVLQQLRECRAATVRQLDEMIADYEIKTLSGVLNRLEAFGLVEKPEKLGGPWQITPAGLALFEENAVVTSEKKPESEAALESEMTAELEKLDQID